MAASVPPTDIIHGVLGSWLHDPSNGMPHSFVTWGTTAKVN